MSGFMCAVYHAFVRGDLILISRCKAGLETAGQKGKQEPGRSKQRPKSIANVQFYFKIHAARGLRLNSNGPKDVKSSTSVWEHLNWGYHMQATQFRMVRHTCKAIRPFWFKLKRIEAVLEKSSSWKHCFQLLRSPEAQTKNIKFMCANTDPENHLDLFCFYVAVSFEFQKSPKKEPKEKKNLKKKIKHQFYLHKNNDHCSSVILVILLYITTCFRVHTSKRVMCNIRCTSREKLEDASPQKPQSSAESSGRHTQLHINKNAQHTQAYTQGNRQCFSCAV